MINLLFNLYTVRIYLFLIYFVVIYILALI